MSKDVAVFLDLDNLVIGAKQANLSVNFDLLLQQIEHETNGRIVLQRAYGDTRQTQHLMKNLAATGFTFQSAVRLNNYSKNVADMQIVVDAMETMVDGHDYGIYILISGDRDFSPLVQTLRKRGKQVIGIGVKHTTSPSLLQLCDRFIFYEDFLPTPAMSNEQVRELLIKAVDELLLEKKRVRASVLKQHMSFLSHASFDKTPEGEGSFRKFLERHTDVVVLEQKDTTTYARRPSEKEEKHHGALHQKYKSALKKRRFRVVPARERFILLRSMIVICRENPGIEWRELVDELATQNQNGEFHVSKNLINAVLLASRKARIIFTQKSKSLSTAKVMLDLSTNKPFQEAVIKCDAAYLDSILSLEEPFVIEEAALALYDNTRYVPHLTQVMQQLDLLSD